MVESNRPQDQTVEKFVTQWLSTYYLSKIFSKHEIIEDKVRQLLGIDIIANGVNYDIKAQASKKYLNDPTNTFSVEISFLRRDEKENIGWFINSKLKTQYYIFVWIPSCTHHDGYIEDIQKAEILIVDKEKLIQGVADEYEKNEPILNSLELANDMRNLGQRNRYVGNLKFVCSNQLFEQPVNIVLKKDWIKQFATRHDIATKEDVKSIF